MRSQRWRRPCRYDSTHARVEASRARLSVIIPTRNEAQRIGATLARLQPMRGVGHEVILVDGGSRDGTLNIARSQVDGIVLAPPGRACQMNAGAAVAGGEVLWFLHADTLVPEDAVSTILDGLAESGRRWGCFDVRLSGRHGLLRIVERMMNLRSRLTGIATGDQGIFVERACFQALGGFPHIALMEDIALSRALVAYGRPLHLRKPLVTSSRRWEENGIVRTILMMWRLRLSYALGADPVHLVRRFEGE